MATSTGGPPAVVYSTGQTTTDILLLTNLTSSLQPPVPFTPSVFFDASYIPSSRSDVLLAIFISTIVVVFFAFLHRNYVRPVTISLESFFVLFSFFGYIIHTSLSIYGIESLQWGLHFSDWTLRSVEINMKIFYVMKYLSDAHFMTAIRLCLLIMYIQRRTFAFRFILGLSVLNFLGGLFWRLFFCGKYVSGGWDIWVYAAHECSIMSVDTSLCCLNAISDMLLVGAIFVETRRIFPSAVGILGSVPAVLRIYYTSKGSLNFETVVDSTVCSQVEGCIFLLLSCEPLRIRDLISTNSFLNDRKGSIARLNCAKKCKRTPSDSSAATTGTMLSTTLELSSPPDIQQHEGRLECDGDCNACRNLEKRMKAMEAALAGGEGIDIVLSYDGDEPDLERQQTTPSQRTELGVVLSSGNSSCFSLAMADTDEVSVHRDALGPRSPTFVR